MTAPHEFAPGLVVQGPQAASLPLRLSDFKLIAFDMDSTLINIECIDEIADAVGKKAEVAAITEAAMRGELPDFKTSLRRRVALLRGVHRSDLQRVLDERLRLNPGAVELLQACHAAGLTSVLVSGGFTFFAKVVQQRLNMHFMRSNELAFDKDRLTGEVMAQDWGDICDGEEKRRTLLQQCQVKGCLPEQAIAVGDGANDIPMMQASGLSVAYHAKPKVRAQATVCIDQGGLDRLLEVLLPG